MKPKIEIEIITYNRASILKQWLELNINKARNCGFACAVYDSSTNNETEDLVRFYNEERNAKIKYVRIPSNVRIDEKVLIGMLESEYTYVWPVGDSRGFDFDHIANKVNPFCEKDYDFMCLYSDTGRNNDGKTYEKSVDFLEDCFWHATMLGGIIFKKDIFNPLQEENIKRMYLEKYYRNDGFSYLGIFYDLIANRKVKASFSTVNIIEFVKSKTPSWLSRYMDVWCGNLVYLVDSLDDSYNSVKAKILKKTWKVLSLDGPSWVYKARGKGGISKEILHHYDAMGYLDRVTDHKKMMMLYTTMPEICLRTIIFAGKAYRKIQSLYSYK